ncbi:DUF6443 domain-containing protein [Flavobacterium sasangense]|uniref:DUF6443 domain-containing protein n=1 Tax=Flavobacterium sasangense TaxID=503361 RepID=UPI0004799CD9|nr:DUF6443 domain-containing protein [Flavobacterium sasangense]
MRAKYIYITFLLLSAFTLTAQVKKNKTKKSSNQNARIIEPGECYTGFGFLDNDGDGYGTGPQVCLDNVIDDNMYASIGGDCDDNNPNVTISKYWYLDADGDGFGGTQTSSKLCYPPNASYIAIGGDCNDSNTAINPNTIWYRDADNDTFGNPNVTLVQCLQPVGYVLNNTDCDDTTNTIQSSITWYIDSDGDGFGNPTPSANNPKLQCSQPVGYVTNNTDCNDNDVTLNASSIFYYDGDGDSFGDPNVTITACSQPANYVTNNLDLCPGISGSYQGCVVPTSSSSFGNRNYIITTTPKIPVTNIQNISQAKDVVVNITYYDDLGKPNQQIANQQSNSGKDIITHIEYDNYNRQVKEYLPFVSTSTNMAFDTSALTNTFSYPEYNGQFPFSEKQFESSPLNRVFKQAAPGTTSDWAMGSGHEIKFDYLTNTSTDAVKLYAATATWNATNEVFDIVLSQTGSTTYAANQLIKTVTKDENWTSGKNNTTEEFKDKEGKVILKRTYSDYIEFNQYEVTHDTYYVYDQYNNLTYVIPPLVSNVTSQLDGLCYQYKYDYRNRLVEKKLPGKQWEFIVYDKLDRVVATGPTFSPFNQESTSGWMLTKYDAFNRPILTAWQIQTGTFSSAIRKTLQSSYNSAIVLSESKSTSDVTINMVGFRYTNTAFPTSGYHVLTVNYYDDYNFSFAGTIYQSVEGQTVFYNATNKPKGLTTGTWVRILGDFSSTTVQSEKVVMFYDEKARIIRSIKTNHLGGSTQVDSNLQPMTGRTNYTVTSHKKDTGSLIIIKEEFTYSDQDRLIKQTHQINNGAKQLIASHSYDELGKLISKYIGGSNISGSTGLQKVNFEYNIRGWLTKINDINNLSIGSDPQDLFAFKISYNQIQNHGNTPIPMFNGNISETYWISASDNNIRKYIYKYDNLNRLKDAIYMRPNTSIIGNYNESLTYDKNGNITTLNRSGENDSTTPINIDALTYGYESNTNKLIKVDDTTNHPAGFKELVNSTTEYTYDANGNMTKDDNKGITSITYNHLNLPKRIIFSGNNNISYIYNAIGQKVSKTVSTSGTTTFYLDGFQYTGNSLDYFPHAEGYVATGNKYVFQYKDHLGNVRVSFKEGTTPGTTTAADIIEENHYYPFGLKHNNPFNGTILSGYIAGNKYKFNGKEYQDELGLNVTAMDFRMYDNALGRFHNIDKMTDIMPSLSPYRFAFNNPVLWGDPTGLLESGGGGKAVNEENPIKLKEVEIVATRKSSVQRPASFDYALVSMSDWRSPKRPTLEQYNKHHGTNYKSVDDWYYHEKYVPAHKKMTTERNQAGRTVIGTLTVLATAGVGTAYALPVAAACSPAIQSTFATLATNPVIQQRVLDVSLNVGSQLWVNGGNVGDVNLVEASMSAVNGAGATALGEMVNVNANSISRGDIFEKSSYSQTGVAVAGGLASYGFGNATDRHLSGSGWKGKVIGTYFKLLIETGSNGAPNLVKDE